MVLAMLGLNASRVMPTEQLIDAVWNTEPPTTARAQIQICVSGLRKVLTDAGAPMTIRTRAPGYVLEVPSGELDTEQFTGLVEAARGHVEVDRSPRRSRPCAARWRCGAARRSPGYKATSCAGVPRYSTARG
nr:helix-turn-helix domain-containing protein [Actinophytocola sp.]